MIVAGFGFRQAADEVSLRAALARAQRGQPPVTALAAPKDKALLVGGLARALKLPLITVSAEALQRVDTATRSAASVRARGTGSVAEASALVAAGTGARLLTSRHISPDRMATCAIAQGFAA
ncbi:cobalamin biosynthesis protein [Sphingomonas sp. R86520]|uniref:cobalamin biosynthesis protein n=1 Tax=Sphingomonas sp. R86520 TaxID=3093859 RepID=UPI0036D30524